MKRADKKIHPARLRGEDMRKWPIVGRRQKAIAGALTKPMTSTALSAAVHSQIPTMERTQAAYVLGLLSGRGLVRCVNPRAHFGKLYELTEEGAAEVARISQVAGIRIIEHDSMDGRVFAMVHRSVVLTRIMIQMLGHSQEGAINTNILRRWVSSQYPVCFPVFRKGLQKLEAHGLLRYLGKTLIGRHRMFMITKQGKAVAERLKKEKWN